MMRFVSRTILVALMVGAVAVFAGCGEEGYPERPSEEEGAREEEVPEQPQRELPPLPSEE